MYTHLFQEMASFHLKEMEGLGRLVKGLNTVWHGPQVSVEGQKGSNQSSVPHSPLSTELEVSPSAAQIPPLTSEITKEKKIKVLEVYIGTIAENQFGIIY